MLKDNRLAVARAANDLRGRGPNEWAAFLAALQTMAHAAAQTVVNAPTEGLQVAQGRARSLNDLIGLLESAGDITKKADEKTR